MSEQRRALIDFILKADYEGGYPEAILGYGLNVPDGVGLEVLQESITNLSTSYDGFMDVLSDVCDKNKLDMWNIPDYEEDDYDSDC